MEIGQIKKLETTAKENGKLIYFRLFPSQSERHPTVCFSISAAQASALMQVLQACHSRYEWPSAKIRPSVVQS